jgi:predicted ATPase/DNA-binding SARP family transcriptional activator
VGELALIGILGPLEVRHAAGDLVEITGSRLRRLLIQLAVEAGRPVTREQLTAAVWNSDPPEGAANALQSLMSRLRRALPDGLIESKAAGYRLRVPADAVDAHRFEVLARRGQAELAADPAAAAATLRAALGLWRGQALADAADAEFAAGPAARLAELRLCALEDRIAADLLLGAGERLIAELESLVAAHPLRERLRGEQLRALAAAGRPAEALRAYAATRRLFGEQLGTDPSPALQELHVALLRGDHAALGVGSAAGLASGSHRTGAERRRLGNLRAQLTSFVGRDADLARLEELLGRSRLITVVGPGGAGKTRLAVEAARRLQDRAPDGAWVVELAPVSEAAGVPLAVLAALRVRELVRLPSARPPATPVERLAGALADKELLLVLDNCEHLVAEVAALVDYLLGRCPQLRVLATSREPLGITGESLYPLAPLQLPAQSATVGAAKATAAVQLFCDRAVAVSPSFTLDAATVAAVVRVCRSLDGLPLAIELAAARLRALSIEQVADRLDDRFPLLSAGSRTAAPRHQTLRAVVDWSWQLLDDDERRLARRLAVFANSARLEAVERVCGDAAPVLDLLAALVEKSLVTTAYDRSLGEARYWMLETVRAYAEEKLAAAGEADNVRRAHATYFRDLVELADPQLRGHDQLRWLARLTADHDDIQAALRWAVEAGEADIALRIGAGIGWYWFMRGHRDSSGWVERALALPGEAAADARAGALMVAGVSMIGISGDLQQVAGYFGAAVEQINRFDQLEQEMTRLHPLLAAAPAMIALFRGDNRGAVNALRPLTDHEDPWARAFAHLVIGLSSENLGESAAAEAAWAEALDGFGDLGERWGMGHALAALANREGWRGDDETAIAHLESAASVFTELGDTEDEAQLAIQLAMARARMGEEERASQELAAAIDKGRRIGARELVVAAHLSLAELARRRGEIGLAGELLDRAVADFADVRGDFGQLEAVLLAARGHLDVAAGDLLAAGARRAAALAVSIATGDAPVIARIVELDAEIALERGDPHRAATLLGHAEALRGGPDWSCMDARRVRAGALRALGEPDFTQLLKQGAARSRDEMMARLSEEVRSRSAAQGA